MSTVMLAQITIDKTGKRQHDKETCGDSKEFPMLWKNIPDTRFKKITDAAKNNVQRNQFQKTKGKRFGWP